MSAQHSVAIVLLQGAAGVPQFADDCVTDPAVIALRQKVAVQEVADMPVESARVTIEMQNGRMLEEGRARPWHAQAAIERCRDRIQVPRAVKYGCPSLYPEPPIDAVWSLDRTDRAGGFSHLPRRARNHNACQPPSIGKVAPVMSAAASLQRKTTSAPTFSNPTKRSLGLRTAR